MSTYEPGTVVVATVRGVKGVRVMPRDGTVRGVEGVRVMPRDGSYDVDGWVSAIRINGNILHYGHQVTDVRPLVVLDIDRFVTPANLAAWLRTNGVCGSYSVGLELANQIEAQTLSPRIDEPGLWGVVESRGETWVRGLEGWVRATSQGMHMNWSDLIDPTLVREGL